MSRRHDAHWRRTALQVVLWIILGATAGVAALVSHHRQVALRIELGEPVQMGDISIRPPTNWVLASRDVRGTSEAVRFDQREGGESVRNILIVRQQLSAP